MSRLNGPEKDPLKNDGKETAKVFSNAPKKDPSENAGKKTAKFFSNATEKAPLEDAGKKPAKVFLNAPENDFIKAAIFEKAPKKKKSVKNALPILTEACIGLLSLFSVLLLLLICLGSFRGFTGLGEAAGGTTLAEHLGGLRLSAVFGDLPLLSKLPNLSSAYNFAVRYAETSVRFCTAFVPKELLQLFSGTAAAVGDSLLKGLSALFGALLGFLTKGY